MNIVQCFVVIEFIQHAFLRLEWKNKFEQIKVLLTFCKNDNNTANIFTVVILQMHGYNALCLFYNSLTYGTIWSLHFHLLFVSMFVEWT